MKFQDKEFGACNFKQTLWSYTCIGRYHSPCKIMFADNTFLFLWLMMVLVEFFQVQLHKLPLSNVFMFHLDGALTRSFMYVLVFRMVSLIKKVKYRYRLCIL